MAHDPQALSSRAEISGLVDFARRARVRVLFVQIYRANQAWFSSKIADSGPYEICVKNVSADPLAFLISKAHRSGIKVYAWLNMLSLGENRDARFIKKYGPGVLTRNIDKKRTLEDYKIDKQYFLEPGDTRIRQDLSGIVEEALRTYPGLDGILFDYVRYPDTHPVYGHNKINIERFKKASGIGAIDENSRTWKDWKRGQVTELLERLIQKARSVRPRIRVAATGCMPYSRAYHEAFQDWPSWIGTGLVDFVAVMDYSPGLTEFKEWIIEAKTKVKDFQKIDIGVGAYKLEKTPDIFKKEFEFCEKSGAGGCAVFHYGSLAKHPALYDVLIENKK